MFVKETYGSTNWSSDLQFLECLLASSNLKTTPCGKCYDSPHFTGEKTEIRECHGLPELHKVSASVQAAEKAFSAQLQKVGQVTVQGVFAPVLCEKPM